MKEHLRTLLSDRLVWFVALGLLLFAVDRLAQSRDARIIRIDLPLVEKLVAQWEGQTKRRPNARELDALIEGYIREEILVREAQRLGLDDDDVIIRRRLAQKSEFLLGGTEDAAPADEPVLRAWFDANAAAYALPARLSWRHVFAEDEAQAADLARQLALDDADWQARGRPFMLNRSYARQSQNELAQVMGADFAAALFAAPQAGWFGPVRSAYGWHAVQIDARRAAEAVPFEAVADRVARDRQVSLARAAKEAAWAALRAEYSIELQPLDAQ